MNEEFKDIKGYENLYQISNYGRVRSVKNDIYLKQCKNTYGYPMVSLFKNGTAKNRSVHGLVGLTFVDNPMSLDQINHIDEDKSNNRSDNLEWCTAKYNSNYGTKKERCSEKLSKKVNQYSKDGKFLESYRGLHKAQTETGIQSANIWQCCIGKRQHAGGYIWKYAN